MSRIARDVEEQLALNAVYGRDSDYWLVQRIGGRDVRKPVGNIITGRDEWRAAVQSSGLVGATRVALESDGYGSNASPCSWSASGGFHDDTKAHVAETASLVAQLDAAAPEGYSVSMREDPTGWLVVFKGSRFGEQSLRGSSSSNSRVEQSWYNYLNRNEGV